VEEFDLELDSKTPRLVVEGLVENNEGPHYIKISESNSGAFIDPRTISGFVINDINGVNDAKVILSDDTGQVEELELIDYDLEGNGYEYNGFSGYVKYVYDEELGHDIPVRLEISPEYTSGKGFYKTKNFTGVSGRTYSLKVTTKNGEVYEASDYMHPISKIDSVKFQKELGDVGKFDDYAPILYFKDPEVESENRYLVQFEKEKKIRSRNVYVLWEFAILSDKYFKNEETGVSIDNGGSSRDFGHFYNDPGEDEYIRMNSLSKNAYNFYNNLLGQFKQDGGAYKPTPSSPITNISNNGLGFFRASATVDITTIIPDLGN
jgi:hypothetical protein